MKTLLVVLLLLSVVSLAEEFTRHSISLSVVPFVPVCFYPDIGYEYSISSNHPVYSGSPGRPRLQNLTQC